MDYCHLRKEFPETISMDQLYRICHISKRKAHWLLENGIIPCRDSGKHTRRFSIPLEEVIRFLELRDAGMLENGEMIYALPKALNDYRFAWSNENKTVYVRGNK